MNKLDEIKAFIVKSTAVMTELAQAAGQSTFFSAALTDEIIELQQELRRYARRIGVISVRKPFFEEAEYEVLIRFDKFSSFINLSECEETVRDEEDAVHYVYSIIIDNIVLKAIRIVSNEEHKKAQAI